MINFFKKKENNNDLEIPKLKLPPLRKDEPIEVTYYLLEIKLNNGDKWNYKIQTEKFPYYFRKLLNWYHLKNSDTYNLISEYGTLSFNRKDIIYILTQKEIRKEYLDQR